MARKSYGSSVSVYVDVAIDDVLSGISDDLLKQECVARGILPESAPPKSGFSSVSLDGEEMDDIRGMIMRGDIEGAMLHLEWMLPREFRVFVPHVARGCLA